MSSISVTDSYSYPYKEPEEKVPYIIQSIPYIEGLEFYLQICKTSN